MKFGWCHRAQKDWSVFLNQRLVQGTHCPSCLCDLFLCLCTWQRISRAHIYWTLSHLRFWHGSVLHFLHISFTFPFKFMAETPMKVKWHLSLALYFHFIPHLAINSRNVSATVKCRNVMSARISLWAWLPENPGHNLCHWGHQSSTWSPANGRPVLYMIFSSQLIIRVMEDVKLSWQ